MITDLLAEARRHAGWVLGIPALVGALVIGVGLLLPRTYEVSVVVSPVSSRPSLGSAGLAASVLGASMLGGLQSTPTLVARLARLDGVLLGVAHAPSGTGDARIIDRLQDESPGEVSDRDALERMRKVISATSDVQTGLVTLRVSAKDSAMVRLVTSRILSATSDAFVQASRAHASALKHAQDQRLDSASRRLRSAEEAMLSFRSTNRSASDVSTAALREARLRRDLDLAENLYSRAAEEREIAASKELEETPALVVVDGLPTEIQPRSRGLLLRAVLWSGLALVLILLGLQLRLASRPRTA